ncbi:MAG: CMP-N,N'-diacetyllegionaminic acid synthase [Candidatus Heimdallarchaeota archaeon LC_2]|nr:MAG: CMP-N,N'-diacetyllegionaminic acid synthase [Candidatus Heimdallarchaeota archaeon LC_2]
MADGIAIIPARMGSKGVQGKNWKKLGDKSLIQYSIDAFRQSQINFELLISTDDDKIMDIASENEVNIHVRSEKTASDKASMFEVIQEIFESVKRVPNKFLLLQPTSPFRSPENISHALKLFDNDINAIVAMKKVDQYPILMFSKSKSGQVIPYLNPETYRRRQDVTQYYYPTGSIYLLKTSVFLEEKTFYPSNSKIMEVSQREAFEIDTIWDWKIAEKILETNLS